MAKNKLVFEKDEKKSIIIAIIVSIVVVLAVMLAFVAIKRNQRKLELSNQNTQSFETEVTETFTVTEGNAIVTNQEELNMALADETAETILLETEESQTIVIPAGDYRRIRLMVNAPNTEITNFGIFGSVTINQIASNTWTESISGNSFTVDAMACHFIIPSGITVESIENVQAGSTLAVELQGNLSLLALEASSSITSIQIDGGLSQIMVYTPTNLSLTGSCRELTPVQLAYGSDGTILTSAVPVSLDSFVQAQIELKQGAEASSLLIDNAFIAMKLVNNTAEEVVVTKPGGKEKKVAAGDTFEFAGESTSSDTGSGNSSGSSTSSGASTGNSTSGGSTSSSSASSSSTSSSGNKQSSSTTGTTVVNGYTKSQVESMVNAAVAEVNAKTQEKIDAALDGMISQDKAQELVNEAVIEAQKKSEEEQQKAIQEALAKAEAEQQQAIQDALAKAEAEQQQAIQDALAKAEQEQQQAIQDALAKAEQEQQQAIQDALAKEEQEQQQAIQDAIDKTLAKAVIVGFVEEAYLYAGEQGSLPGADTLALPKEVQGRAGDGEIYTIPVKEWKNTDLYSESVTAGAYRFTAVLESSENYYVAAGVEAHTTVYVKPTSGDNVITYKDAAFGQLIQVTEYRAADYENVQQAYPEAYYVIENTSESAVIYTALDFSYYDSTGNLVEQNRWNGIYIQPGKSWIAYRTKPCVEYAYYVVEVDNFIGRNTKVDSLAKLQASENSSIQLYKDTDKMVSECTVMVLYLGTDKTTAYGMESFSSGGKAYPISINDTSEEMPLSLIPRVPDGADLNSSIIVWKGGYE